MPFRLVATKGFNTFRQCFYAVCLETDWSRLETLSGNVNQVEVVLATKYPAILYPGSVQTSCGIVIYIGLRLSTKQVWRNRSGQTGSRYKQV